VGFYIILGLVITVSVVVYKSSSGDREDKVFAGIMTFILAGMMGALVAFLALPGIGSNYVTEYSKPLKKYEGGEYIKLFPHEGEPTYVYRPHNGLSQYANILDGDEIHLYRTNGQPRVERRCGRIADWVFPWDAGTYGDFHGCDINFYVPSKTIL
jgi:hypothetical protein